jgi:hypothetical protein
VDKRFYSATTNRLARPFIAAAVSQREKNLGLKQAPLIESSPGPRANLVLAGGSGNFFLRDHFCKNRATKDFDTSLIKSRMLTRKLVKPETASGSTQMNQTFRSFEFRKFDIV